MNAKSKPLKILGISEIAFFKLFSSAPTIGGIESNYKNILRGMEKRGHLIYQNRPFPRPERPDIIICPTFGPFAYLLIWVAKKHYACACVQHGHTTLEDLLGGFLPYFMAKFATYYLKNFYKFSNILITPSNYSRKMIQALEIPTSPPIIPVSNGVDLSKFSYSDKKRNAFRTYLDKKYGIDSSKPIVLCVSVLWKRKGIDVFHDMALQLPEYNFIWVGNYTFAPKLKQQYDDLPNLTFTGFVPDVVAAYCGSDVFFFPSRAENQGIPLLEAAACSIPIICRDLPTYDWIQDGVHCLKTKRNAMFKERIQKVIVDKKLREKLVHNALENVQAHDSEKILDKVESIYREAIKMKKRAYLTKFKNDLKTLRK